MIGIDLCKHTIYMVKTKIINYRIDLNYMTGGNVETDMKKELKCQPRMCLKDYQIYAGKIM